MKMRIDYHDKFREEPLRAMLALEKYVHECGLEPKLLELVKMRASQINGCAYCIDMHSKDARALGETEQRLYALNAWRETPFYSERERAGLEWTEAVTLVSHTHVPDEVYEQVRKHFIRDVRVQHQRYRLGPFQPCALPLAVERRLAP